VGVGYRYRWYRRKLFPVGYFLFNGWVPLGTVGNTVWLFVGSALIHSLPLVTGTTGSDDSFW